MLIRLIMKAWVRTALWFRFRKIQIHFHTPVPLDQGAILAGNHQNAIQDSITMAARSPKVPYTLSRASLFDNRLTRSFLEAIRMLPIYRFRDGFGGMRKNAEVFQQFVGVLEKNGWLLIFPEGNHELRYNLRRFQKGIARIVFAAQVHEGWAREIPIVPVGLQYESHTRLGGRLLIQFGEPVSSLKFHSIHSENPKEAERRLTQAVWDGVRPLLILPPEEEGEYEAAVKRWEKNKGRFPDLMDQFRSDREIVEGNETVDAPSAPKGRGLRKVAGYLLSLPGLVLHLPVTLLCLGGVRTFVRDVGLIPAARFLAGMFLFPPYYLLVFGILFGKTGSLSLGLSGLGIMALSLWVWSRFWHWAQ